MHCDDKRTAAALRENVAESESQVRRLAEAARGEPDAGRRGMILEEISELEGFAAENRRQLDEMAAAGGGQEWAAGAAGEVGGGGRCGWRGGGGGRRC